MLSFPDVSPPDKSTSIDNKEDGDEKGGGYFSGCSVKMRALRRKSFQREYFSYI